SQQQLGSRYSHCDLNCRQTSVSQRFLTFPQPSTVPVGSKVPSQNVPFSQSKKSFHQKSSQIGGPQVDPSSPTQSMQTWAHTEPDSQVPSAMASQHCCLVFQGAMEQKSVLQAAFHSSMGTPPPSAQRYRHFWSRPSLGSGRVLLR